MSAKDQKDKKAGKAITIDEHGTEMAAIDICRRLKSERVLVGLSQVEVSGLTDVSVSTVKRWEREAGIPADALMKLADVGFDPAYVLMGPPRSRLVGRARNAPGAKPDGSTTNIRLRQERKRSRVKQSHIAELCEVSSRTVIDWERDAKIPAQALSELHKAGFDVLYIITGESSSEPAFRRELEQLQARLTALISDEFENLRRY